MGVAERPGEEHSTRRCLLPIATFVIESICSETGSRVVEMSSDAD